jgi:hypothetical protein
MICKNYICGQLVNLSEDYQSSDKTLDDIVRLLEKLDHLLGLSMFLNEKKLSSSIYGIMKYIRDDKMIRLYKNEVKASSNPEYFLNEND